MTWLRTTCTSAILAVSSGGSAMAQGIPVFDATSVARLAQDAIMQNSHLAELVNTYNQLQTQYDAITGDKGIGGILNGAAEQAARDAATGLSSIITGAIDGTSVPGNTGTIDATIASLRTTFDLDSISIMSGSTVPQDRAIAVHAGSGLAAMATAEDTYSRANDAMGRVNGLITDIDSNADLKASIDYNTRMMAELAVLLNENLRLQASMANAMGADVLARARDAAASREFRELNP